MGDYPVIGIRPTIDGRRGAVKVRESLEAQTMNMALSAKKLFEENLRYSNGEPVKVVIADTTIGRAGKRPPAPINSEKAGVDITLTVTPCWCYGSETMDMDPNTIKGRVGLQRHRAPRRGVPRLGARKPRAEGPAGVRHLRPRRAGRRQTDIPDDVREKLLRFGRAAVAIATMRGKSYLQIGSICMGIAGSIVNPDFFEEYLGMRVESVDEVEIIRRMENGIYDKAEFERALAWRRENCPRGFDKEPRRAAKDRRAEGGGLGLHAQDDVHHQGPLQRQPEPARGCEEEMVGHNAIAGGFQGQRQWTDFTRTATSRIDAQLDVRLERPAQTYVLATENDTLNGVSMLFGKLLTNTAQIFADVRTYWSPEAVKKATGYELEGVAKESKGFIHLINSGAACIDACGEVKDENGNGVMKPFWEMSEDDCKACLKATTWNAADMGYFRGGGFSSRFLTRSEMPVTMMRLNLVKGLGPVMQLVEGWTVSLPDEVSDKLWKRTDYTWPCTWFAPRLTGEGAFKSAYDVMNKWGANHGAISYGHIGADVITLCSMLRIPVCMQ